MMHRNFNLVILFIAGSREDVFSFCNQFQDSVQSMKNLISRGSSQLLTADDAEVTIFPPIYVSL